MICPMCGGEMELGNISFTTPPEHPPRPVLWFRACAGVEPNWSSCGYWQPCDRAGFVPRPPEPRVVKLTTKPVEPFEPIVRFPRGPFCLVSATGAELDQLAAICLIERVHKQPDADLRARIKGEFDRAGIRQLSESCITIRDASSIDLDAFRDYLETHHRIRLDELPPIGPVCQISEKPCEHRGAGIGCLLPHDAPCPSTGRDASGDVHMDPSQRLCTTDTRGGRCKFSRTENGCALDLGLACPYREGGRRR